MNSHLKYIEDLAQKTLSLVDCDTPPIPIEKITEKVGLRVIYFNFHDKISGLLKKDQGIIAVNNSHSETRQRFSIAHELGHFLLNHEIGKEQILDDRFDRNYQPEKEANIFSSFILMPKSWVKKEVSENDLDIEILAKKFQVSKQAITVRLLELDLIK